MDHLEDWEILDYHDQDTKKKRTSSKPKAVFNKNCFMSPSSHNQLIPIPFQLDQDSEVRRGGVPREIIIPKVEKFPEVEAKEAKPDNSQETLSQVYFKKIKENKFVDMKLDSLTQSHSNKALLPPHQINFEDDKERSDDEEDHDGHGHGGLNIWKWSLTGIGAICSFGVAAVATISVVIIGNYQRNKKQQELRFQFISNDKPMSFTED